MNVKRLYISIFVVLCSITSVMAADTLVIDTPVINQQICKKYAMRVERMQNRWNKLIPNIASLQYAGGIGMFSLGVGWDYGKRQQWETHLMFGFLPKSGMREGYASMTIKEVYTPFDVTLNRGLSWNPFYVTLMLNTTLDGDFWVKEPERYPDGYYGFSNKVRFHLGFGQKFEIRNLQHRSHLFKDFTFYYEVSSCDLYIRQKFLNSSIPLKDLLSIGIGLQYTFF